MPRCERWEPVVDVVTIPGRVAGVATNDLKGVVEVHGAQREGDPKAGLVSLKDVWIDSRHVWSINPVTNQPPPDFMVTITGVDNDDVVVGFIGGPVSSVPTSYGQVFTIRCHLIEVGIVALVDGDWGKRIINIIAIASRIICIATDQVEGISIGQCGSQIDLLVKAGTVSFINIMNTLDIWPINRVSNEHPGDFVIILIKNNQVVVRAPLTIIGGVPAGYI